MSETGKMFLVLCLGEELSSYRMRRAPHRVQSLSHYHSFSLTISFRQQL